MTGVKGLALLAALLVLPGCAALVVGGTAVLVADEVIEDAEGRDDGMF